jgi:hypothetical protein
MIEVRHQVPFRQNVVTGKQIVKVAQAKTFGAYIGMTDRHPVVIVEQKQSGMVTNATDKKKQKDVHMWVDDLLSITLILVKSCWRS